MEHRVLVQELLIVLSFGQVGQNSFYQKVGDLDEVAVVYKVLYIIAAVAQDSLLTVDIADG